MKVRELITILEDQDADAEVLIMSQERWPFENRVYGVAVRAEMERSLGDPDDDEPLAGHVPDGGAASDVFIVEGRQLRYGSKVAWDVATR